MPPFATLRMPSLGVHLLLACARLAGFHVRVRYANFLLAEMVALRQYEAICRAFVPLATATSELLVELSEDDS